MVLNLTPVASRPHEVITCNESATKIIGVPLISQLSIYCIMYIQIEPNENNKCLLALLIVNIDWCFIGTVVSTNNTSYYHLWLCVSRSIFFCRMLSFPSFSLFLSLVPIYISRLLVLSCETNYLVIFVLFILYIHTSSSHFFCTFLYTFFRCTLFLYINAFQVNVWCK